MRLNVAAGGHEIDFPDGTTHRFAFNTETLETYDTRLVEIHDSFKTGSIWNNRVAIGYTSDGQGPIWEVSDSHGRVQRVYFRYLAYDAAVKPMVDRLELTAFDGRIATYQFRYFGDPGEPAAFQLRRDCRDGAGATPGLLDVALLSSVVQPDGSKWAMDYWNDVTGCPAGQLESLTLPSGGRIDYAYSSVYLPTADDCDEENRLGAKSIVLAARTFVEPVSASPDGMWTYSYLPSPIPSGSPDTCLPSGEEPGRPSEELLVVVQTPLNDKTEHFFSTWPLLSDSPMGFRRVDYGLPITRELEPGDGRAPIDGRYLSSRSYDCDAGGLNCVLKRSEYLTYDDDANSGSALDLESVLQRNRRVKARRTVYHDDSGKYRDVVFSDFDGLGHHRVATWSGTFDAGNDPIERVGYLPSGSYPGSFTPILPTSPWILGTYAHTEITEAGDTSRRELTFDAATGFLDCERWLKTGTVRSPQDVLVRYSHVEGDVTLERFFGGDTQALQTGAGCGATGTLSPRYALEHQYAFGVRKSTKHTGVTFFDLDLDIDVSGLPSVSRDPAGLATLYEWDTMFRRTAARPQ
ncbi:MAG: hypothetical protein K8H90_03175, partial [Thermoanaerobaculia bacterium]|nr:hypothetical protein [Thermoanaerobaculia bacterium]